MNFEFLLLEDPLPYIRRITLNRPEKRNAISTPLRVELLTALQEADNDPEVKVSIIRGAGPCFSSGYDLKSGNMMDNAPHHTASGSGQWSRQVTESWLSIWDLAKPVIAQIHGYAMAGATELAAACDLVYVAEDAQISHPVVKVLSPPDFNYHPWLVGFRHAMEMMLTGDSIDGKEAARIGFATRAYPPDDLEENVLERAATIATTPSDLLEINKRSIHRAMEILGVRNAIRAMSDYQALAAHLPSVAELRESKSAFDTIKGVASKDSTKTDTGGTADDGGSNG